MSESLVIRLGTNAQQPVHWLVWSTQEQEIIASGTLASAILTGAGWADVDAARAIAWLQAARTGSLIHGHTHRPGWSELGLTPDGSVLGRQVLSDWELDHTPTPRAEVLRLSPSGVKRLTPAEACHG